MNWIRVARAGSVVAMGFAAACGGAPPATVNTATVTSPSPQPEPPEETVDPSAPTKPFLPPVAQPPGAEQSQVAEGTDKEHPVPRCGPADSYRYVATYKCADGTVPLQGDLRAASKVRSGNVGPNATGHIIDLYVVPCPGGDVKLFVDMYGCPETKQDLVLQRLEEAPDAQRPEEAPDAFTSLGPRVAERALHTRAHLAEATDLLALSP
ncbi:hypothetical protein [Chondromyces crocatus]|uniref:Lipoprotein n=1 Tax=Chondromyces crocatus TaxID=52 RepID=A0A0K1EAC5_CHOCO|nr:hypothetical protein [Chondromyces crocatus]AKT37533.1 uncharacterized protein CMC5_016740 [Chondromyces crocatus]